MEEFGVPGSSVGVSPAFWASSGSLEHDVGGGVIVEVALRYVCGNVREVPSLIMLELWIFKLSHCTTHHRAMLQANL